MMDYDTELIFDDHEEEEVEAILPIGFKDAPLPSAAETKQLLPPRGKGKRMIGKKVRPQPLRSIVNKSIISDAVDFMTRKHDGLKVQRAFIQQIDKRLQLEEELWLNLQRERELTRQIITQFIMDDIGDDSEYSGEENDDVDN
jgi:hypothetical protein